MTERQDKIFEDQLEMVSRLSSDDPVSRLAKDGIREYITRLHREKADAERRAESANIDFLTGIGNRRALETRKIQLERAMIGQRRNAPHAVVVAFADIEGLKHFNEVYSPAAGDEAIKAVATSLSAPFRDDEWYRRGGDEFIGLMPVDDDEGLERVLEKLTHQAPVVYDALRTEDPNSVLPRRFPVVCAKQIYRIGGEFRSLNEAEIAADPKTAGKDFRIQFSS